MVGTPKDWRALFGSPDEEVRREAVAMLRGRSDAAALECLDQALGDESWRVRKAAVEVFRSFPDHAQAVRVLISALADCENAGRRTGAMESLTAMGKYALPHLHDSVNHPDADVRKFIIDILGVIRDSSSVDCILPLTRDSSEVIRLATVEALGAIGGHRAFDVLLDLLPSEDVSLQFSVLHALGKIGKPIPLDSIRPLLDKRILRRALYEALGQTKSPEAVQIIIQGLIDATKSARQAAVRALFLLSSDPGLEDYVKQAVKKNLSRLKLEPLAELLETNHLQTKRAAIKLLAMIGTPEAAMILAETPEDDALAADVVEALARRIKSTHPESIDQAVEARAYEAGHDVALALREGPAPEKPAGPMEYETFQLVRDLVAEEAGLFYDRDLKYLVERRVQRRMEEISVSDYDEYMSLIQGESDDGVMERRRLINALSTNETYFFREDFQLRAFKEEILPAVMKLKESRGERGIRIWSAGCSSGEEPYTIAILVKESGLTNVKVEIIGSDINENMINSARQAVYNNASFRVAGEDYMNKYFVAEGGRHRLINEIRKMVSFDSTNLMTCGKAKHLRNLDIIFCRNVIIYFSPEAKRKVVEQFYQLLNPGGYLLLGHSESLMSVSSSFALVHLKNDLVYRKPGEDGPS